MKTSNQPIPRSISFLVLALNEAVKIEETVKTVLKAAAASTIETYELVLVNDGSNDTTGEIMDRIAGCHDHIHVVHNHRNLGFGAAYLRGVEVATQEYVMIIAGDNIMPASSITAIIDQLGSTDIVLPYMIDANSREVMRRCGSWLFTQLVNLISGNKIRYYNGMVVRKSLFTGVNILATGYSLQAETVIKFLRGGATYSEIGVVCGHASAGKASSKALRLSNLANLLRSLLHLFSEIATTPSRPSGSAANSPGCKRE